MTRDEYFNNVLGNRKRKRHDSNHSTSEEKAIKITIEMGSKTYSGSIPLLDTSKN